MTQTSNRFFDEIGRLMNDAAGAAQGVKREVDTVVRNQAERILRDLDLVKREEFDAVKDMMRMLFDGFIGRTASLGSPGVNEMRWLAPLRPGDDLTLDVGVAEARISKSRPETGIVTFRGAVRNAAGVVLCEMESPIIVRRRTEAGEL